MVVAYYSSYIVIAFQYANTAYRRQLLISLMFTFMPISMSYTIIYSRYI